MRFTKGKSLDLFLFNLDRYSSTSVVEVGEVNYSHGPSSAKKRAKPALIPNDAGSVNTIVGGSVKRRQPCGIKLESTSHYGRAVRNIEKTL